MQRSIRDVMSSQWCLSSKAVFLKVSKPQWKNVLPQFSHPFYIGLRKHSFLCLPQLCCGSMTCFHNITAWCKSVTYGYGFPPLLYSHDLLGLRFYIVSVEISWHLSRHCMWNTACSLCYCHHVCWQNTCLLHETRSRVFCSVHLHWASYNVFGVLIIRLQ